MLVNKLTLQDSGPFRYLFRDIPVWPGIVSAKIFLSVVASDHALAWRRNSALFYRPVLPLVCSSLSYGLHMQKIQASLL
ncbi:MAG TPA: hypothetical protein VEB86_17345 [Chryseosolibacter sp.]|nr:hypothetical protein [Chryseosolibacter sp.]